MDGCQQGKRGVSVAPDTGMSFEYRVVRSAEEVEGLAQATPELFEGHERFTRRFLPSLPGNWLPRVAVVRRGGIVAGILYAREKTIGGVPTGLLSADTSLTGMFCAEESERRGVFVTALKALLAETGTRGIRLVVAEGGEEHRAALDTACLRAFDLDSSEWFPHGVLTLPGDYGQFLDKFGYKSRRNFRYYRRNFEAAGHSWVEKAGLHELPGMVSALRAVCRFPGHKNEIESHAATVLRSERPLIAGLRHSNGAWLGMAAGWHDGPRATLLFQLQNDLGFERESLSVVLRAYLIESLIAQNAKELVFVNNVAGPLARHADMQWIRTRRIYVDRRGTGWGMVRFAARMAGPRMPAAIRAVCGWIAPPAPEREGAGDAGQAFGGRIGNRPKD